MSRQSFAGPMTYSEAQAARVRKELAGQSGIVEKQMFGGIAFLLGGNMAVGVHGEDLIVRVDPAQTNALLREAGAKPFDLSGSRGPPAGSVFLGPPRHPAHPGPPVWRRPGTRVAPSP